MTDAGAVAEPERGDELAVFHPCVRFRSVETAEVQTVRGGEVAVGPGTGEREARAAGVVDVDDVLLKGHQGRIGGEFGEKRVTDREQSVGSKGYAVLERGVAVALGGDEASSRGVVQRGGVSRIGTRRR